MGKSKKKADIQIGRRLQEARTNLNCSLSEFASTLGVTDEHYRKLEAGYTRLSVDKIQKLYKTYGIDPAYLITGVSSGINEFDVERFAANSTKEQRNAFFDRVFAYMSKMLR